MEKYLYFAVSAPNDSGANEQVIMVPASNVSHFEMAESTKLDVFFKVNIGQEAVDMDAGTADSSKVRMIITTGKHLEAMKAIAEAIGRLSGSFGFVTIADSENSVFCSEHITSVESITVLDAS